MKISAHDVFAPLLVALSLACTMWIGAFAFCACDAPLPDAAPAMPSGARIVL